MPTLKQGSSGTAVKKLQNDLQALGFDPNGADGKFGAGTKKALIAFQKSRGLNPDGSAGPITLSAIEQALAGGSGASTGEAEILRRADQVQPVHHYLRKPTSWQRPSC